MTREKTRTPHHLFLEGHLSEINRNNKDIIPEPGKREVKESNIWIRSDSDVAAEKIARKLMREIKIEALSGI